jgi:hypothetical protein
MAHIESEDALTILAGLRRRGGRLDSVERARERNGRADGLRTASPGDRGHVTVLELVRWRCGVIVYRAIEGRPWTMDGETIPRLAFRRPKFDRLLGGIAFVGPYAIWLVCAPKRRSSGSAPDDRSDRGPPLG